MKQIYLILFVTLLLQPAWTKADGDIVIADFEGPNYGDWVTTGTAFGSGPASGGFSNQQKVDGFLGHGLVNSCANGDGATGTLTSPGFVINRGFISFLIGGGNHADTTCMNLVVNEKRVETATGIDDEHLDWFTWDVSAFRGKMATIQIVDAETGSWGHINVDQIIQTDKPPVLAFNVGSLYHESLRPQFHYSSATNWINDPNGLVFFDGEYHLFFQHNPSGIHWGNMTWGHAVSADLVHWTQLPDALNPDELGTMFSGSAVVDWNNTSGFGLNGKPPLIAMYTAAGGTNPVSKGKTFSQCIAFSNDKGRTWTKYKHNPVIPHIVGENRDPKVVWYDRDKKWIVALYKDGSEFALFSSPDLKTWTHLQDVDCPDCSECPDFFPIQMDSDPAKTKWVFTVSMGKYLVGEFDGKHFTADGNLHQVDFGRNYYAVQTFSNIPKSDGRRIQIAWMRDGKYPRMPFNGQMSFPSEMTLKSTADGPRIFRMPAREISLLHGGERKWNDVPLAVGDNPLADVKGDLFHIQAEIDPGSAAKIGFHIRGQTVSYSIADHVISALGECPLELENGHLFLDILVDQTTIETFANHGRVSFTSCYLPKVTERPLEIFSEGGAAKIVSLSVFSLKSAWPASSN